MSVSDLAAHRISSELTDQLTSAEILDVREARDLAGQRRFFTAYTECVQRSGIHPEKETIEEAWISGP